MIAVSIIAYNFYKNIKEPVNKTAFEAIPINAAVIIKENNFNAIYNKIATSNIIWEELVANTATALNIKNQLHYLDSLLSKPFAPLFNNTPILSSIHLSGANNFDFIFYLPIVADVSEDDLIQKIKNVTKKNTESREYDGATIHTIATTYSDKISLVIYKKTLIFSYSTILIEDVIRQLNSNNNLLNDPTFEKVINTSGQSEDGNLFVNTKYFSKIVTQYVNKSTKAYLSSFENYTGWTELDVNIKPNSCTWSGFSFTNDVDNYFIHLFKGQKPQEMELLSIIPSNTSFIYYYGLSNSNDFFENRVKLLKSEQLYFNYQKYLDELMNTNGIDLEATFLSNIGNELALVITESQSDELTNNQYIIFKSNEIEKTKENLSAISKKIISDNLVQPIEFNGYSIQQLNISNMFSNLLGKPFTDFERNYYTIIDDYVVFGNSESALQNFITSYTSKKVLSTSENFKEFYDNFSSSSTIFIYNNIARSSNLYKIFGKEDFLPMIDEKIELFRKFEAVAFQVTAEKNNLFYNTIFLKYNPVYKQETSSLWELELDSTISSSPQLVVNHLTNSKEIIVQDDANTLYLISNTGKLIWSKQLSERIMSKFYQIDIFKNNKLQLLFNTKSKIYLIDRNGNNVGSYPIKLPSDATNGISVLDYANDKNYRLLIGCDNNMVYNYTAEGNKVTGWEYISAENPATGNIWHFAPAGKDYIVVPLKNGKVKVIERSGKDRLKIDNKLPFLTNEVYLKVGSDLNKTYLITSDTLGNIVKLFFNDKKEITTIENIPKNATFNFFDYNSDNSNDYIYTWNNQLKIVDADKKEIFSTEFQSAITQTPQFFNMPDKSKKIGLVTNNQIYLLNSEGKIEENFPLLGSTSFTIGDINNDKTTNLVVADKRMIYTYVLN